MGAGNSDEFGLSRMGAEAVGLHELFKAWVEGGFTERQALVLLAEMMAINARNARESGEADA